MESSPRILLDADLAAIGFFIRYELNEVSEILGKLREWCHLLTILPVFFSFLVLFSGPI
jgi:hypothetical protein